MIGTPGKLSGVPWSDGYLWGTGPADPSSGTGRHSKDRHRNRHQSADSTAAGMRPSMKLEQEGPVASQQSPATPWSGNVAHEVL